MNSGTTALGYTGRKLISAQGTVSLTDPQAPNWAEELHKVAEQGDKLAFTRLFNHFAPRLRVFAFKQTGNDQAALDLVQETMSTVWLKASLYSPERGAVSTWIYTIARNLAYDRLRRLKSRPDEICADDLWPVLSEQEDDGAHHSAEQRVLREQLKRYFNRLSPPQLEVVQMVYMEERSQQEVAEVLKVPLGTVKSRLRLAIDKLRQSLTEEGDA